MTPIALRSVTKVFPRGNDSVVALEQTNLEIDPGEILCVVGPSGCGKTTVLNLIAGFIEPTAGEVLIGGQPAGPPDARRAVVFQQDAVFPWLTVRRNIEYGPRMQGLRTADAAARVEHFMDIVGLSDFADAFPKQLSGGMRKRVDLARAYVSNPQVLLMDEPFGALDVFTREAMWLALRRVLSEDPKTVFFVTHDIEEAIFVGDRIVVMTPRPAKVRADITVPFPRDRELDIRASNEFQALRLEINAYFSNPHEVPRKATA